MGIQDLNPFLEEKCPNYLINVPLSSFYGKRVSIDASNLIYERLHGASKQVLYNTDLLINDPDRKEIIKILIKYIWIFIRRLIIAGVTPVFIFDGKSPPEKEETRRHRKEDKVKTADEIKNIRETLSSYTNESIVFSDNYNSHEEASHSTDQIEKISQQHLLNSQDSKMERLRKLYEAYIYVTNEEYEIIKNIVTRWGIPCITAKGEAEELCVALCRENLVIAVYSKDTDNLTHGCTALIKDFIGPQINPETNQREEYISIMCLSYILIGLNLSFSEFVDFCIMCKCDYNKRIPGIGIKRAYKLITEHKSIDNLPINYDKTPLKHIRCRELFKIKPLNEVMSNINNKSTILSIININKDYNNHENIIYLNYLIEQYNANFYLKEITILYTLFPFDSIYLQIVKQQTKKIIIINNK